jgi:hypothetical protein
MQDTLDWPEEDFGDPEGDEDDDDNEFDPSSGDDNDW